MDGLRFDTLTRSLAAATSRRSMLKGFFGGAVGVVVTTRAAAAQECDPACESGFHCCPGESQNFCIEDSLICCGVGGTCPADEVCCGDTNCCPASGYVCNGAACCETCERYPTQCGEVRVFCGNDPVFITCPTPEGSICCSGTIYEGDCCENDECGDPSSGTCGEMLCVDHLCALSGACQQGHECCDGACCDEDQYCCGDMCQDDPCDGTGCKADKDCKHGCCCKRGDCSDACCSDSGDKDEHKPEVGGGSVVIDTLPNTGTGSSLEGVSLVGAAALLAGAAAAAGAKLRKNDRQTHRA